MRLPGSLVGLQVAQAQAFGLEMRTYEDRASSQHCEPMLGGLGGGWGTGNRTCGKK